MQRGARQPVQAGDNQSVTFPDIFQSGL